MFSRVLIANRGEIAVRIAQTLIAMGITPVGMYTRADRNSKHVRFIPECIALGDSKLTGYLDIDQIIKVAKAHHVDAIHPGYGFLSENAEFARECREAGIVFIGPQADVIAAMGDKISARNYAEQAGVPIVPGVGKAGMTDDELVGACEGMTFPLLVKPSAGGGGKGLHIVNDMDQLRKVIPIARREAFSSFSDETLFVERYIRSARHIEFQVLRDRAGNSTHLGERECTIQRRHQKVIEEAPSAILTKKSRERMAKASLQLIDQIGYENVGTIEFLVDAEDPEVFYFMEMNTRLQVEHRVTEMITGLDLVECQVRIALGESLKEIVPEVRFTGHAVQARVYAEDPYQEFLPTTGRVGVFRSSQSEDTINDFAVESGTVVSSAFDPMLGKVICWAPTRDAALESLKHNLEHTVLIGVTSNIDFLIELLQMSEVRESTCDTAFLGRLELVRKKPSEMVFAAGAHSLATEYSSGSIDPSSWENDGWRFSGMPSSSIALYHQNARVDVEAKRMPLDFTKDLTSLIEGEELWIHHPSFGSWKLQTHSSARGRSDSAMAGDVVSPLPGVVIALHVEVDQIVAAGDSLVTIEAMKMEHIVRSKLSGKVTKIDIGVGESISGGKSLLEIQENV